MLTFGGQKYIPPTSKTHAPIKHAGVCDAHAHVFLCVGECAHAGVPAPADARACVCKCTDMMGHTYTATRTNARNRILMGSMNSVQNVV